LERATGIEPAPPAWESKFSILYFQYLQNRSEKICVHATHTVHTMPDLRIAGGRLGGRFLEQIIAPTDQVDRMNSMTRGSTVAERVQTQG